MRKIALQSAPRPVHRNVPALHLSERMRRRVTGERSGKLTCSVTGSVFSSARSTVTGQATLAPGPLSAPGGPIGPIESNTCVPGTDGVTPNDCNATLPRTSMDVKANARHKSAHNANRVVMGCSPVGIRVPKFVDGRCHEPNRQYRSFRFTIPSTQSRAFSPAATVSSPRLHGEGAKLRRRSLFARSDIAGRCTARACGPGRYAHGAAARATCGTARAVPPAAAIIPGTGPASSRSAIGADRRKRDSPLRAPGRRRLRRSADARTCGGRLCACTRAPKSRSRAGPEKRAISYL
jgi:hypothetical protein